MISFEIPKEPILRGYLFSFINSLDPSPIRVRSEGDFVIIEHIKKRKVTGLIAKVYEKASSKIEGGNFKVALSNNDKAIIIRARTKDKPTIFSALGLTPEQSMEDVFKKTASIVKQMTNEEFQREYYTSRLRFAPPSLLRIEHYQAGRAPFFISKKLDRTKPEYLTLLQIVTFLAGYVISHSGYVLADGGQRRAMLILPQVIGKTKKSFYDLILDYYKNYKPPGARPEEALYLWFALTLPEEIVEVSVVGVKEPYGANPSSIDFSLHINLELQKRVWEDLGLSLSEDKKLIWLKLLSYALSPKTEEKIREDAIKYSKLLFKASQGSAEAARELLLSSSRTVAILAKTRAGKRDLERQKLSAQTSKIAEKLLSIFS